MEEVEIEKENITKEKEEIKEIEKRQNKNEQKKSKKIIIILITALILLVIGVVAYLLFVPKFKDATIELGTQEINQDIFIRNKLLKNKTKFITDLSTIDLSSVRRNRSNISI